MSSTITDRASGGSPIAALDRLAGLGQAVAIKAPCLVATTANITLSGLQTIDGVTLAAGDRVLVKDQTLPAYNGIWLALEDDWVRASDLDDPRDGITGTRVFVRGGTAGGGKDYYLSFASDPIVFGTTAITVNLVTAVSVFEDGTATTAKLADGAVTTAKLADGAVTTAKLADVNVTYSRLDTAMFATVADYRSNVGDKILRDDIVWSAMAEVTLTDAATITWDMSTGFDFFVTLAGNRTMDNPTAPKVGQRGRLRIKQDATGSRTLAWANSYEFTNGVVPILTTNANAEDIISYDVISPTRILITVSARNIS